MDSDRSHRRSGRLLQIKEGMRLVRIVRSQMESCSPPHASTIVIVDDDHGVLSALEFALSAEGYRVRSFRTAEALYASAEVKDAACLVIDQILADETGLALLARLRDRGDRTPAVLITTGPQQATILEAARLDAPIIEKPLLGDHLFACIRELIADAEAPRRGDREVFETDDSV